MGIRNSMVATSSDINPTTQGYGALDSEMERCSYERRMVKRLRYFDSGKGAVVQGGGVKGKVLIRVRG